MKLRRKLLSAALSAGIAIGICGFCPAPLFAQDTNKSSKRAEQGDKKKAHAKKPAAPQTRNANTGASASPYSQPATSFPVNGY